MYIPRPRLYCVQVTPTYGAPTVSNPLDALLAAATTKVAQVAQAPVVTEVPALALPLLPHQVEGAKFALTRPASYLAFEQGTGKTPTAIAVLAAVAQPRMLVVCPPSLRTNWSREIAKFAPWLTTATLTGTKAQALPQADVLIIGDAVIAAWADTLAGNVSALVVDEAHRAKNRSKRTAAIAKVSHALPVGAPRLLLSGTPTPNGRHAELATQLDILGPTGWKAVGGKGYFWGHFCPQVDSWGGRGSDYHAELNDRLQAVMSRVLKRDVLQDLPNKGRTAVATECKGRAVRDYLHAESDLIDWLESNGGNAKGAERAEALVRMTTLRRLAGEAKVEAIADRVKELLDDTDGGVFIVAEHNAVMDHLILALAKFNPVAVRGGMSDKAKTDAVDAFNAGTARVLVGQVDAAGVGLTLHGNGRNHHVVVAQLPWTPAQLVQAEDRLHRIGQVADVQVEVALAAINNSWTIDERLWSVLEAKNFSATSTIDGEGEYLLEDAAEAVLSTYRSQAR